MGSSLREKIISYVVLVLLSATVFYIGSSHFKDTQLGRYNLRASVGELDFDGASSTLDNQFSYKPVKGSDTKPLAKFPEEMMDQPQKNTQTDDKSGVTQDKTDSASGDAVAPIEESTPIVPVHHEDQPMPSVTEPQAMMEPAIKTPEIAKQTTPEVKNDKGVQPTKEIDPIQQKKPAKQVKPLKKNSPAKEIKPAESKLQSYSVQLGAFSSENAAKTFLSQLEMIGVDKITVLKKDNPARFIVVCGQFPSADHARNHKKQLLENDIEGFIVKL
tara:strand:+ start:6361 stop:7179 length:819 start_codon:yes stop_codon:yes gene_type:complete